MNGRVPVRFSSGEAVAAFGLLATILGCLKVRPDARRAAGSPRPPRSPIRPADARAFVAAQIAGALLATAFFAWLHRGGSAR